MVGTEVYLDFFVFPFGAVWVCLSTPNRAGLFSLICQIEMVPSANCYLWHSL